MIALLLLMVFASVPAETKGWRISRGSHVIIRYAKREDPSYVCLYAGQSYYVIAGGWQNCP